MAYEDDAFASPPTILVVDDSPTITALFARLLADMGRVVIANDGATGLQLARSEDPDLILLDVSMPGQDGFDVISELKTDSAVRHIPVMFITGEVHPEIEVHCLEAGAADYIAKPVTPRVLQARARTHLLLKTQADMLAELSFRDLMTGALNRISFDERLDAEYQRAVATWRPLSLVLLAVDQVEAYRQVYGFVAGDDVMVAVADAVRPLVRSPGAVLARTGADEFAVLLPETGEAEAVQVGDQLREAVQELGIRHSGSSVADVVTASVGIGTWQPPVDRVTPPTGPADAAGLLAGAQEDLVRARAAAGVG